MGVHAVPAVIKERHLTTRKVEALCGCFIHLPTGGLEVGGHLGNINLVCPSLLLSILGLCWSSCQEPYLATLLLLSYKIQTRPHHLLLTFKMETAPSFMHSTHTSDNCDLLPDQVRESGSQRTCSFIILGQLRVQSRQTPKKEKFSLLVAFSLHFYIPLPLYPFSPQR